MICGLSACDFVVCWAVVGWVGLGLCWFVLICWFWFFLFGLRLLLGLCGLFLCIVLF